MSSSSLSIPSSSSLVCSCSGKLCFCELVSPVVTTPSPSPSNKKPTTAAPHEEKSIIVPGCLCFRCEMIREEVYTLFDVEEVDDIEEEVFDADFLFGCDFPEEEIDEVNVVSAEEAKETFLVTSLC